MLRAWSPIGVLQVLPQRLRRVGETYSSFPRQQVKMYHFIVGGRILAVAICVTRMPTRAPRWEGPFAWNPRRTLRGTRTREGVWLSVHHVLELSLRPGRVLAQRAHHSAQFLGVDRAIAVWMYQNHQNRERETQNNRQ